MDGFLIFILIIVCLYYVGKWYLRHKINKFFGQFGGQFNGQYGGQSQNSQQTGSGQSAGRRTSRKSSKKKQPKEQQKKVFTKDEGEYVDFVEIKE